MGGRGYRVLNKFKPFDCNTICDETGFKKKLSETMTRWDGFNVIPEAWNPQQPQDFAPTITKPIIYPAARAESSYPPLYVAPADLDGLITAWESAGITSAWLLDETSGTAFSPTIGSNALTATEGVVLNQPITGYSRVGVDFSSGDSDLDGIEADFNTTGEKFSFTALIETGSSVAGIQTLCFISGTSGNTFNFYIDAGQLKFQNYGSGILSSGLTVSANTVYKVGVVMTDSPDILTVYLDSSKYEGAGAGTNGDYGTFETAKIGNATGEGSFIFLGIISCPAVSTTALTSDQIESIFSEY